MAVIAGHPKAANVIRTIRIPDSLDKALRKMAEERNLSVNALVGACLTRLIEFDQYADELDYVMVRRIFLMKGLEYLKEAEIRELARWAAVETGSETLRFYNAYPDVDLVVHVYESIISKYGRLYTFRHETKGSEHTITMTHRMGENWSIFFEENMKAIFGKLGIELKTEGSANFVKGHFVEKS